MAGEFKQGRAEVRRSIHRVRGMPADDGENAGVSLGNFDSAFAAGKICADAIDPGDAGSLGAFDDLRKIRRKLLVIQVGVSVVKRRRHAEGP